MYALYSVLIVLFFLVMSPYFLYQAIRHRKYIRSLPQRRNHSRPPELGRQGLNARPLEQLIDRGNLSHLTANSQRTFEPNP